MKTSNRLKLLLAGGGVLIGLGLLSPGNGIAQQWHMRLAARHAPLVRRQLALHSEFKNVYVTITTADDGALVVYGNVNVASQKEQIKRIVTETKPPVKVLYWLRLPSEVIGHSKPNEKAKP